MNVKTNRLSRAGLLTLNDICHLSMASPRFAYANVKRRFFGEKTPAFPHFLVLYLNNSCNMACPMCNIGAARKSHIDEGMVRFMPIELIRRLAKEAKPHGALLTLFGGEPLLYPDLEDALRVFRENRLLSDMVTNGLLLEKKADLLVKGPLNILMISLDGWDEDSQLKRGKVPGAFEAIASGIRRLVSIRGRHHFPILRLVTTITKNNFHSLDKIQRVIHSWGVKQWVINNYQFVTKAALAKNASFRIKTGIGESIVGDRIGDEPYFSSEEVSGLKSSLAIVRKEQARLGMNIYYNWSTDLDAYYSTESPIPDSSCTWPFTRADIQSDGGIFLCMEGKKIGDLFSESLTQAWHGERAQNLRHAYDRMGVFPMCFRCCGMYDSISFRSPNRSENINLQPIGAGVATDV